MFSCIGLERLKYQRRIKLITSCENVGNYKPMESLIASRKFILKKIHTILKDDLGRSISTNCELYKLNLVHMKKV
jgi:hypothetical protein